MAIESNFRELFSETVTIFSASVRDMYGKWSHGASVSAPAHLVSETERITTLDGREVVQTGKVYLYGVYNVSTNSRLVFTDGSEPVVLAVDSPHDQNGPHHTVIRIGEVN